MSPGTIAGVAIGSTTAALIAAGAVYFLARRHQNLQAAADHAVPERHDKSAYIYETDPGTPRDELRATVCRGRRAPGA